MKVKVLLDKGLYWRIYANITINNFAVSVYKNANVTHGTSQNLLAITCQYVHSMETNAFTRNLEIQVT